MDTETAVPTKTPKNQPDSSSDAPIKERRRLGVQDNARKKRKIKFNPVPVTAPSVGIRQLFAIADEQEVTSIQLALQVLASPNSLNMYRRGRAMPNLLIYEEMAQVLGYEIKLVKINE